MRNIEWTGGQQITFFVQSVVLGIVVGVLLDVAFAMLCRNARRRWLLFDVLSGPQTALLVMFGALVIMDGHLHPLLLLGSILGMVVEHLTLAGVIRWGIKYLYCFARLLKQIVLECGRRLWSMIHAFLRIFIAIRKKSRNLMKKH